MPQIATIDDGASKHVVHQGIRPSPGAGVVCVGFVVTEVGVAVIVRVQSAELSSVQRFVLRLIGDWGAGSERIGGIALLDCPLPRSRRRSTTTADLLIWTPSGCTLVLLADFRSVQHGVLDTPSAGRWQVGERAADLRTGAGAVNPLQRARRQRAELAAIFRRAGVPEQIDVLVVLIPKTGSRMTWAPPPQEPGEETIMARIGRSTGFTEYFQRSPDRPVCLRDTDIAQAFAALGVPLSAPDPEEMAAEGFVMTAAGTLIGTPTPADSAGRLWKAGLPLFGGSRRRAGRPDTAFPGPGAGGAYERAEYADAVPSSGTAGVFEKRAPHDIAPNYPADRVPASGSADALPEASGGGTRMASVPRQDHSEASVGEFDTTGFDGSDPDTNADVERRGSEVLGRTRAQENTGDTIESGSERLRRALSARPSSPVSEMFAQRRPTAETAAGQGAAGSTADPADEGVTDPQSGKGPRKADPRRDAATTVQQSVPGATPLWSSDATGMPTDPAPIGRAPADQVPVDQAPPDQVPVDQDPADHAPEEQGSRGRSAERLADRTPRSPAADIRSGRETGAVRMRGLRNRLRTNGETGPAGVTDGGPVEDTPGSSPAVVGGVTASPREVDPPASAEEARGAAGPAIPAGSPVERCGSRSAERGPGKSVRIPVGVRRGIVALRRTSARARDRASVVRSAGSPRGREHARSAGGLRMPDPALSAAGPQAAEDIRPADVAGQPGKSTGAGGRGARYAAAVGAAGVALAVVAGTVFAASGFARFEVAEYGALCQGGGGTTVAAPYAVTGPSPVHLAGELSEITTFGPSAVWHPVDARSVQLVACVSEGRLGELVRTCQYPPAPGHPVGRTLNLFAMAYRLDLYEARTGNRLAAIDLTGEQFASDPASAEPDRCRAAAGAPEDGLPGRRHSRLSHQQIQRALAPFVTPAAPHIQAAR
ncbi:hypothetical protein [Nocardia carnea]|uniref:hypothetical protein n=1 Tax=Nocardia carnea TaxID=37328 RepID=UPI0012DE3087|nr:hypothetical protein [Nocardia carnea]